MMKTINAAAALGVAWMVATFSPCLAKEPRILLTPAQTRVYHDCLTEDWIEDYCRGHSWGIFRDYDRTNAECIAAQHHGKYVVNSRPRFANMEAYCWDKAHGWAR